MTGTIEDKAREVLAKALEASDYHDEARHARNGLDDPEIPMGEAVDALLAFRNAALNEAAEVARARHELWRMPHPDDANPCEVCCDVTACEDIAAGILTLKSQSPTHGRERG